MSESFSLFFFDKIGSLLIGVSVSMALFGVTCVQVFYYFQNHTLDDTLIKRTVITSLILESLHSAFGLVAIYKFFEPVDPALGPLLVLITLGISSAIILIVNIFYVRRVHFMSKNILLVAFLAALTLAHLATGIAAIEVFPFYSTELILTGISYNFQVPQVMFQISLSLRIAMNLIIAGSLSFYSHKGQSELESTNTLINKLMAHTIDNGILTSAFDIIALVFVTIHPDYMIFLAIFQVVGNLYTNSMLATLNSRKSLAKASHLNVVGPSQAYHDHLARRD